MAKPKAAGGGKKPPKQAPPAAPPAGRGRDRRRGGAPAAAAGPPQYGYRAGFASPVHPQVAAEEIKRLQNANGGIVKKHQLVAASRPPEAPVHDHFEWDDVAAAEAHREGQAGELISAVRVISFDEGGNKSADIQNVMVTDEERGRGYATVRHAFTTEETAREVLAEARRAYIRLYNRYRHLEELEALHAALRRELG